MKKKDLIGFFILFIFVLFGFSLVSDSHITDKQIYLSDMREMRQYCEDQAIDYTFFQCIVEVDNGGDYNVSNKYTYDKESIDDLLRLFSEYEDTYEVLIRHTDGKMTTDDAESYVNEIFELEKKVKNL